MSLRQLELTYWVSQSLRKAVVVMEWDESMVRHDADMIMSDFAWSEVQHRVGGATLLELVALDEMQKWIEAQRATLVRRARLDDEHTWTEIGHALGGISKQAAAKRYGHTAIPIEW